MNRLLFVENGCTKQFYMKMRLKARLKPQPKIKQRRKSSIEIWEEVGRQDESKKKKKNVIAQPKSDQIAIKKNALKRKKIQFETLIPVIHCWEMKWSWKLRRISKEEAINRIGNQQAAKWKDSLRTQNRGKIKQEKRQRSNEGNTKCMYMAAKCICEKWSTFDQVREVMVDVVCKKSQQVPGDRYVCLRNPV